MKRQNRVNGMIAGMALLAGSVLVGQRPVAHAAGAPTHPPVCAVCAAPRLYVGASYQNISITGANFSASGRAVSLLLYGIHGGTKSQFASYVVIPATTANPDPNCLIACAAGSFWTEVTQPNDPCNGGSGYAHIEVDAWTSGPHGRTYQVARATATATCPITQ